MRKILLVVPLFAGLAAAGAAQAQIKCWTENGKRVCGDTPPPGAKTMTIRAPSGPADAPAAASKDAKDAGKSKGPMTPAEREQDYRKRQAEAQKAAQKADDARKEQAAKQENCSRAREALATLDTGRVARIDAKGERYFLDDNQLAQERARTNQLIKESCN